MTALVYALHINVGVEFFFVLYGVLSVFFLQNIYNIIFSFTLSMVGYLLVCTVWREYGDSLEKANYYLYLFNHLLAIFLIFCGLLLIKNENTRYQNQTRDKNWRSYGEAISRSCGRRPISPGKPACSKRRPAS